MDYLQTNEQEIEQLVGEIAIQITNSTLESTVESNTEEVFLGISSGPNSEIIISSNYDIVQCIVKDEGESLLTFTEQSLPYAQEEISNVEQGINMEYNLDNPKNTDDEELTALLAEMNQPYSSDALMRGCFPENPLRSDNMNYIVFNDTEEENRVGSVYWCECGNCIPMTNNIESICCKKITNAGPYLEAINCITEHEFFYIYCQREETVTINLRSSGMVLEEPPTKDLNRLRRKTAYRSFTGWIHGYLGAGNRRPIPSCAVASVRSYFPDPDLEYLGFKPRRDHAAEFMAFE